VSIASAVDQPGPVADNADTYAFVSRTTDAVTISRNTSRDRDRTEGRTSSSSGYDVLYSIYIDNDGGRPAEITYQFQSHDRTEQGDASTTPGRLPRSRPELAAPVNRCGGSLELQGTRTTPRREGHGLGKNSPAAVHRALPVVGVCSCLEVRATTRPVETGACSSSESSRRGQSARCCVSEERLLVPYVVWNWKMVRDLRKGLPVVVDRSIRGRRPPKSRSSARGLRSCRGPV